MGELKNLLEVVMGIEGIWFEYVFLLVVFVFSWIFWECRGVSIYWYDFYEEIFYFLCDCLVYFDVFY